MNFNYQISEQDYFNATTIHQRNLPKNNRANLVAIFVFFLIGCFVYFYIRKKGIIVIMVLMVALIVFSKLYIKQKLKSEYKHNALIKLPIALSVTDKGCSLVSEDTQVLLRWEYIYRYIESDKYWLLYISPNLMYIIPKLSVSETEQQQFSDILKQHIGGRRKLDKTMCNLNARKANNQK